MTPPRQIYASSADRRSRRWRRSRRRDPRVALWSLALASSSALALLELLRLT